MFQSLNNGVWGFGVWVSGSRSLSAFCYIVLMTVSFIIMRHLINVKQAVCNVSLWQAAASKAAAAWAATLQQEKLRSLNGAGARYKAGGGGRDGMT